MGGYYLRQAQRYKDRDVRFVRLCEVSFRMRILVITVQNFKFRKKLEIPRQPGRLSCIEQNIYCNVCVYTSN
jgi:hypothetical protein